MQGLQLNSIPFQKPKENIIQEAKPIRRKRIACDFCNAKHIKCSGEKPKCEQCKKRNQECKYTQNLKSPLAIARKKIQEYEEQQKISAKEIEELQLALLKANQYLPTSLKNVLTQDYGTIYISKFRATVLTAFPTIEIQFISTKYLKQVQVADNLDELCSAFESTTVLAHGAFSVGFQKHANHLLNSAQNCFARICAMEYDNESLESPVNCLRRIVDGMLLYQFLSKTISKQEFQLLHEAGKIAYTIWETNKEKIPFYLSKRLFCSLIHCSQTDEEQIKYLDLVSVDTLMKCDFYTYVQYCFTIGGYFATSIINRDFQAIPKDSTINKVLQVLEIGNNFTKAEFKFEDQDGVPSNIYFAVLVVRGFLYKLLGKNETAEYWVTKALPFLPLESLIESNPFYGIDYIILLALHVIKDKLTFKLVNEKVEKYLLGYFPVFDSEYKIFKEKGSLLNKRISNDEKQELQNQDFNSSPNNITPLTLVTSETTEKTTFEPTTSANEIFSPMQFYDSLDSNYTTNFQTDFFELQNSNLNLHQSDSIFYDSNNENLESVETPLLLQDTSLNTFNSID